MSRELAKNIENDSYSQNSEEEIDESAVTLHGCCVFSKMQ